MKRLLIALALTLSTCAHVDPVPSGATCEAACTNGARLSCEWATPTPAGATCLEVCANADRFVPWPLACLARTDSCDRLVCP
jgi:hypothetical protein